LSVVKMGAWRYVLTKIVTRISAATDPSRLKVRRIIYGQDQLESWDEPGFPIRSSNREVYLEPFLTRL
jgi:hypothetical protein